MKWMGWSCEDFDAAPPDTIREIITMINEEQEERERRSR